MLVLVLGQRRRDGGTPYTMAQVDDHAYGEGQVREFIEGEARTVLATQYGGVPARLLWIEQDGCRIPDQDLLEALADGAQIPWTIVQDTDLTGESGT